MLIAQQKRKENIAEFLLYMFQVEDLIRAYSFDIDLLEVNIISKFDQPFHIKRDMREWYLSLIGMMKNSKLKYKGHIPHIKSLIADLESFHIRLLHDETETEYRKKFENAKISIDSLRSRSPETGTGEIETCLNGLYGLLLLRLSKKEINPATSRAFALISDMISTLSAKYLDFESGRKEY